MHGSEPTIATASSVLFELEGVVFDEFHAVRSALHTCALHYLPLQALTNVQATSEFFVEWTRRRMRRPREAIAERAAGMFGPDGPAQLFALAFDANRRSVPSAGVTLGRLLDAGIKCGVASAQAPDVVRDHLTAVSFSRLPIEIRSLPSAADRPGDVVLVASRAFEAAGRCRPTVRYVPLVDGCRRDEADAAHLVRRLADVLPLLGIKTGMSAHVDVRPDGRSRLVGLGFDAVTIPDHCIHLTRAGVSDIVGHGADAVTHVADGDPVSGAVALARVIHRIARMSSLLDERALRFLGPGLQGQELELPPVCRPVVVASEHVVRARIPVIELGRDASRGSLAELLRSLTDAFALLAHDAPRAACRQLSKQLTALAATAAGGAVPALVAGEGVDREA